MKHSRKLVLPTIGLLIVAAVSIGILVRQRSTADRRVIAIGVIQPLTGELANFGKTVVNGIVLAVHDYENARTGPAVRLVIEDDQGKPAVAVAAIQKLRDSDDAFLVIGTLTSSATLAIAPVARSRDVLLVSPTASNPQLSNAGPRFFRVWPSDSFDGMIAATFCSTRLGARTAVVIHVNNDYGLGLSNVFQNSFQTLGGRVALVDAYPENNVDFRTILTKAATLKPDVIYVPGHPRGIATLIKQSRELNLSMPFFANVAAEDKEFLTLAGESATGLYFTAPAIDIGAATEPARSFVAEYHARFGSKPDVHAAKGYEAAMVILNALSLGHTSPSSVAAFLHNTVAFDGVTGSFRFDSNGDVVSAMTIKRYRADGSVETIDRIVPPGKV